MIDSSTHLWAVYVVHAVQLYAGFGIALAIYWLASGLERFDPHARETSLGLKLLLLPGLSALWPLFLHRQLRGEQLPEEHTAHRAAARPEAPSASGQRS